MLYSVTGATGLLGNNVVRKLLEAGHEVRVAVRESSDRRPLQDLPVEVICGDLQDPAFATRLVTGCDGLIHAAGIIWFGRTRREISLRVNVDASCLLAGECARQGVRMAFVSSTDALAAGTETRPADEQQLDPAKGDSAYVASKRAAESALLEMIPRQQLDLVIVNPCLFFGPWDWQPSSGQMILAVTDGFVPLTPSGGISAGDVRKIAEGVIAAMQRGECGERYILAGENLTYLKLWRKMAALAGRKGPLAKMNRPMQTVIGAGGDLLATIIRRETQVNSAALELGACWNYYDSSKAIRELGYDPGCLETALRDAWQWLVTHGYSRHRKLRV
jgi:dihydroflavonol-4-reductase